MDLIFPPGRAAIGSRHRGLAAALGIAAGALVATSAVAQVAQGPMVQAVTDGQAGIWIRTATAQPARVQLTAPDGSTSYTPSKATSVDFDFTASWVVTGLLPKSRYHYQVGTTDTHGVETWTGAYAFDTSPTDPDQIDIAVLSDFANKLVSSPALRTALQSRPDLLAVIGDLDHRGPAGAARPLRANDPPGILADMRAMHRDTRDAATPLGADFFSGLVGQPDTDVAQIPWVYAWDDHDFCANNAARNCKAASLAFEAFDEYYILAPDNWSTNGCDYPADFESLTYGTLAQVFFLDARSNRVNITAQPSNDTLGPCQLHWLQTRLHASKALWKIVMTPVPMNATIKTWDAWGRFPAERSALLASIADVPNVVFVSGDVHSGGAIDDGTHSGRPEVATPHADMPRTWVDTWCRLIDFDLVLQSRPGSWTLGGLVDPILGVRPLQCGSHFYANGFMTNGMSAPVYPLDGRDNPGYVWIDATRSSLELTVRDAKGDVKQGFNAAATPSDMVLRLTPSR